ncbi:uncharacterized protein LOC119336655 isoform X1 [Triticum dicoccoides]|uniref:uncharacterized protein LOC119336655 isoform X1 n=1 Tax=Triticum dicoccoides TaxID=85692 RepID=UPI00188FF897|nr:uncharacterized protein LOC119336655 isoform X1 [Triticum dicoccoides]
MCCSFQRRPLPCRRTSRSPQPPQSVHHFQQSPFNTSVQLPASWIQGRIHGFIQQVDCGKMFINKSAVLGGADLVAVIFWFDYISTTGADPKWSDPSLDPVQAGATCTRRFKDCRGAS